MSPIIKEIDTHFKKAAEHAGELQKKAAPLDGELARRIQKVKEASSEVVEHITKKTGGAQNGA